MCEVESPLSLSGLFIEEKKQRGAEHIDLHLDGFLSLPHEVKVLILVRLPVSTLCSLVTVSSLFYQTICSIVDQIAQFNPNQYEESTSNIQHAFQLLLMHSTQLKSICGVCVQNTCHTKPSPREEAVRFQISPEQLYTLIKRNSTLEHVVIYDFGVREDTYLDKLLQVLNSCTKLKLLYSESAVGHASKVQEFVGRMVNLSEISFPNLSTLKLTMEPSGWFGYYPSNSGILHSRNGSSIQVLRKGKPELIHSTSSPLGVGNSFFDRAKLLAKSPVRGISKGSSLRESIGSSVPRKAHNIEIVSE